MNAPAGVSRRRIGLWTAMAVVVANTVGTGVFTSLGFQAADLPSTAVILALWVVGGFLAVCGALSYAALGAAMPRSGGEYLYLSKLYHPGLGFLSGFVSGTVAFAAPMALAAMAFGDYMSAAFPGLPARPLGAAVLVIVALVHGRSRDHGARFLNVSTLIKLSPIAVFIVAGGAMGNPEPVRLLPTGADGALILSPAFAVALVYVSYAYSGWNASAYLAGEVENPRVNVPRSILMGSLLVTGVYVALHVAFLRAVPFGEFPGTVQVGDLASRHLFGPAGRRILGLAVGVGLVSSISSMVLAGSRVVKAVGRDFPGLRFLARENASGNPRAAIFWQSGLALILLWTATFDQVLTYIGFTLALFTTLAVLGVFFLRRRVDPRAALPWGFPATPLLFLGLNFWMMVYLLRGRPHESFAGLGTLAVGGILYWRLRRSAEASSGAVDVFSTEAVAEP
jgi:APA family basic amino acid/polyamine antiporter